MKATRKMEYMGMYIRIFQQIVLKKHGYSDYKTRKLHMFSPLYTEAYNQAVRYTNNRQKGLSLKESL